MLGTDLSGAITVAPLTGGGQAGEPWMDDEPDHDIRRHGDVLRFSLTGRQLKFSAVMDASGGLTIPAHGVGGSWIVKLSSTQFPAVPENEFVMLELARATGLAVPAIRLVPSGDVRALPKAVARMEGKALAVRRFDRAAGGRRIHVEDFAQVLGLFPGDKYGHRS